MEIEHKACLLIALKVSGQRESDQNLAKNDGKSRGCIESYY